ncbi:hypothetical protein WJX72_002916 [[Myrmecia] bisecta]|uniref:Ketoreductase domain-containing protein n=1 Tax=[Myrmecia] bisecta TaxID=41462 RepID=A0AAW1PNJ0_9CHLO
MSRFYAELSLRDQVALVTGASGGIGEAIAWRLAEAGCKLILVARRQEKLDALREDIQKTFSQVVVHTVALDVQDSSALDRLQAELPAELQAVDILVNNAGLALGTFPVQDNDLADVQTMISTNCAAVVHLTKLFSKGMIDRNRGHIVNLSSVAAHTHYGGGSIYCATKAFLDAFTTAARHDLVATDVRVTAISPGAVKTDFSNVRFKGDSQKADAVYQGMTPLLAADVADNVLYALTRPAHVQIAEIITYATAQSGAQNIARKQ